MTKRFNIYGDQVKTRKRCAWVPFVRLGRVLLRGIVAAAIILAAGARPALAAQIPGDPAGVALHFCSHLFFMFSMAALIYGLKRHKVIAEPGWRQIGYAAFFFILWSAGGIAGNLAGLQIGSAHLLGVPAFFFLYRGIACLAGQGDPARKGEARS